MRLGVAQTSARKKVLSDFAEWILSVGDGRDTGTHAPLRDLPEFDINIPPHFCNLSNENSVDVMSRTIFPDIETKFKDPEYLRQRAILTPTNKSVATVNAFMVEKLPGNPVSYFSRDEAEEYTGAGSDMTLCFPVEYLHALNMSGIPPHELKVKEGSLVMLIRNLDQTVGLCNGTRMIVTKCLKHSVQCEVICGTSVGSRFFIPRIECCPSDTKLPFRFIRNQLPLQLCYAMTINKSQGQSLEVVGIYLPKPVFTHGQLYVAISRVTCPEGLHFFIDNDSRQSTTNTKNVVYTEVFYNVLK